MSILRDVYSLAEIQPEQLIRCINDPSSVANCYKTNGIGQFELAQLGEIIGAGHFGEILNSFNELACQDDEKGPWLLAFPSALSEKLAQLSSVEVEDLSNQGANDPQYLVTYLSGLVEFFRSSSGPYAVLLSGPI